ncbi:MAG: transporter [Sphingomonas bacterium]|uniref:efflux transporter outer membrane subunit n=1 Tax=Sphingomonas bacterium TaxID=1895847 RepID=UPI00260FB212|nr:efflux transporter outer membrane subunit [Sphingomonas bacterium]MDB5703102.1 transporter [Sphingomonas bacterium]
MFRSRILLLLTVALPLQACVVGPDYAPPAPAALGVPGNYSTPAPVGQPADLTAWWTSFNDPLLTSIVDRARAGNLDIAQAVARLRQAHESLVQSRADLLPSVSGSAGYNRSLFDNVGARDNFSVGANVAYQADLFGGVKRGIEASRATYQGSGFDLATVQTSIEAEAARNYILARQAQSNLAIARGSLGLQDDNLEISGFRVQAGLVSSLDVEQSRAQRAQTAATIPSLEQNYQSAVNRLGVLTGQAPGALKAELEATAPIPKGPDSVAVGIPADTLRQRPDVRAAERQLAAATAQIGVTEAQLYPALNITGNIGTAASSIGSLASIVTGGLFAGLTQLIFDAGRTRSRVRAQEAAAEGALANYKQVVLTSLEDVENALTALQAAKKRQVQFAIALDASNNSAILSRSQYRAGLTDITTLNTNESALLSAQNGLSNAKADQAQAIVQLYLALGGGWDSSTVPQAPQAPTP